MADDQSAPPPELKKKKEDSVVMGLPMWMATYSDMVTLLLTFFVLLLSFAKTEDSKSDAAMGSIRNAFGGNVLVHGKVIQLGKSPDDAPTMIDSQYPILPFPIEFLTMEGLLDKHEVNRESDDDLRKAKLDLKEFDIDQHSYIDEMPQSIKIRLKDSIYFKKGSVTIEKVSVEVMSKLIKLLKEKKWHVFVQGYASMGEVGENGEDAYQLSSLRALAVSRLLMKNGISPDKMSVVFYGDSRPDPLNVDKEDFTEDRKVEFLLQSKDLMSHGHTKNVH